MPLKGGVLIDGLYSVEYAITYLALPASSTNTSGYSGRSYSSGPALQATLEKSIAKVGVRLDIYDPELIAILADI